jgi:LPXTG-motif cell wall-anchored protein
MSDDMKNYSKYSVVYIKDGDIVDTLAAKVVNNKYIEFETTHLSEYGVVGEVSNSVDSPNTGVTSIVFYIIVGFSSLVLIGIVLKERINL